MSETRIQRSSTIIKLVETGMFDVGEKSIGKSMEWKNFKVRSLEEVRSLEAFPSMDTFKDLRTIDSLDPYSSSTRVDDWYFPRWIPSTIQAAREWMNDE